MKEMRRWLAMLLCVVMLVGVMPVNALANEEAIISEISETAEIGVSDGISGNALSEDDDPAEGNENVPSEDEDATDPSEDEDATDPSEGEDATDPSEGEDATDPSEGEDATDPSEGEDATDPSEGEDATDPSEDEDATDPSEDVEDSEEEDAAVAVTGITLDVHELEVPVGTLPVTLTATVTPEDATDKTVTWTSSNEDVAFFDEDGLLNFGMIGEADITATAGEFSDTCHVTVFLDEDEITGYADENTTYVLAGGDYQEGNNDGSDLHVNSAENVTNILAQISQEYARMDGMLFVGDYDGTDHNNATKVGNGITSLMETVQAVYSDVNNDNTILVQGNHDNMDSRIDKTGGHDFGNYAAYVLNEDDYPNGGGSATGIQGLANTMKTWLDAKIAEDYTAPIFVVSHLPLHYSPRTQVQGDGKYAKYLFDVLNAAGEDGLNIIFLHGHDHAYGCDNYLGGEAIYRAEGDTLYIADPADNTKYTTETLNFTYMNAGYTGYYNETGYNINERDDSKLTMTVFAITGTEVKVERYSADSVYNLSSKGRDGYYNNTSITASSLGLAYNTKEYASPQTISLLNSDSGEDSGDTEGGTTGGSVGVTPDVEDDVETSGDGWTTITEPESGGIKFVLDTDGVNANTKYLIVNTSSNGIAYVLTNNNGSVGRTQVTISNGTITVADDTAISWASNGTSSSAFANQGRYVYPNDGRLSLNTSSSNMTIGNEGNGEYQIYRTDNNRRKYFVRYNNGWTGTRVNSYSSTTYSVYLFAYDSTIPGDGGLYGKLEGDLSYTVTPGTSAADALAAVKNGITIKYATAADYSDEQTADDGVVTWTLDPNYNSNTPGDYAVTISYNGTVLGTAEVIVPATTTYYIVESEPEYEVAMNTSAEDAVAAVKEKVTVYTASNAEGTDKTAISDDDVSWTWVDTYDGKNIGPYTLRISKDGIKLADVEVRVNVEYETGIKDGWTYVGETEATGGSYTYTLDTDGIDAGSSNKYIIVAETQALALHTSGTSASTAESVNISSDGKTVTTTTRDYEYYWNSTYGFTRGSYGLHQSGYYIYLGEKSASYMDGVINNGDGTYCLYDNEGTKRTLYYNGSRFTVSEESNYTAVSVRLYKYTGTTGGTPGGSIYAHLEGNTVYTLPNGKSATTAMNTVKAGITGYLSSSADGSNPTELEDSALTWTWLNKFNGNVPGSYWVQISYNGEVLGTVEVVVNAKEPGAVNNYPEYPNEGSIKVNKTGTGIDFQSSGIAQVEVSASGVPIKKGADVIVMLDTSSSMTSHTVTGSSKTRAKVLEESLVEMIKQFKTPGDDGALMDLRVAIADFNGFFSSGAYARDGADTMSDDISYAADSEAKVYTGDGTLGAGAFIDAADLANSYTLNYASGTNYDYAMDAIYQLGYAIKQANGSEERDLYVIFMSDGAAMQWNYYHSQGASSLWNNWITGAWTANQLTTTNLNCTTHAYYYDEVDHNGDGMRNEHRMANAIKGDPSETYEVIRKQDAYWAAETNEDNMYMVSGLGAKMFSISFDAQADTNVTEVSMDKSIASLASEQTGTTQYYYKVTTADELANAFDAIGSEIAYAAYNARYVDQMGDDYNLQMAVSNYSVVDGTSTTSKSITPKIEILSYDIYTRQDYLDGVITEDKIGDRKGTYTVLETVTFNTDGTVAYSDKKSGNILIDGVICAQSFWYNTNATAVAVEGVSIPTGTKADGTTTGSTNVLPSETFYWKMGTVQTSELAMRYYVYLDGSMEGTREAGSYPTNEYATLYYDNYLHNPCYKDTVSPVMPWKEANVSYAFYLVDENGNIINNQTTGQTGAFANKIAVTNPVVYDTVLLNTNEEIDAVEAAKVLPDGYTLFDATYGEDGKITDGATYTVTVNSNTTGGWTITSLKDTATTYVVHYDPEDASAYSKDMSVNEVGYDYTHTVVWFAVVWKIQALPDTVVIDYGLPVDISVLTNDMFGENGRLAGVGTVEAAQAATSADLTGYTAALASGFSNNHTGTYGTAEINTETGKVRYTLNTANGMQMETYEKFAYAAQYTGNENAGYYYDTVTVIPATTIYYEDSFVNLKSYTWNGGWQEVDKSNEKWVWNIAGETMDGVQAEDRPGQYALTDANNIYGFDSVNIPMSTYSLGSAMKANVDYDNKGTATFEFKGTGFDVIALTSNATGSIYVDVYNESDELLVSRLVDTYYGYTKGLYNVTYKYETVNVGTVDEPVYENQWLRYLGEKAAGGTAESKAEKPENPEVGTEVPGIEYVWVVDPNADNSLYQIPVMQVNDLTYGKYKAVITASYNTRYDNVEGSTDYDFYLDAIRIYDPANDGAGNQVIQDAYVADSEGWPSYIELRDKIITANTLGNESTETKIEGLVFIDGDDEIGDAQIRDYISYGPNNEVYLDAGQSVAFLLETPENIARVHLGIKSANGEAVTYKISNIAKSDIVSDQGTVSKGTVFNEKEGSVNTTTDMYYDITGWRNNIIVIKNSGSSGIISLTNIKSTYTSNPNGAVTTGEENTENGIAPASELGDEGVIPANETYLYMTPAAATLTLRSLNAPTQGGEEEPDATEPEVTVPETTEPEPTVPETTEPEETVPEETKPGTGNNPIGTIVQTVVKTVTKVVKHVLENIFGGWFR